MQNSLRAMHVSKRAQDGSEIPSSLETRDENLSLCHVAEQQKSPPSAGDLFFHDQKIYLFLKGFSEIPEIHIFDALLTVPAMEEWWGSGVLLSSYPQLAYPDWPQALSST